MFCPVREYREASEPPKGIGWRDPRDLLVREHIQLGGSIVLVWDNLRLHPADPLCTFFGTHVDWLTVLQLSSHAPALSPQDRVWSLVKQDPGHSGRT
ncbi:hypothetical protein ACFC8N_45500 [Streptomyces sp. NPDC055966]|uniref:hypothetical protein n=1 Tax=Streptomyces sp. NPDC055966 TaxID=3345669 RepID=UPI0035DAFCD0